MTSLDILREASGSALPAPSPAPTLDTLFRLQAERTPDAPALVPLPAAAARSGDGAATAWTYRRLDRAADRISRRLAARGLGPGDRVALCLHRTPWLPAAVLGTLRAGATYVPLDPAYPRQRLAFMLTDSAAAGLIAEPGLRELLPARAAGDRSADPILVDPSGGDDAADDPADEGADFREPRLTGDHLSHVIYTSGSTGTPKGVGIRHSAAVAMVRWALETFSPAERAGVLFATSACFDLSLFEMFLPLAGGGAVLLARDVLELAEPAVGGVLAEHPATLINTVPSAVTELLRAGAVPPSVVTVNLAGEALKRHLVERLYALPHVERVYNLYGPSEDTTYSTWERVPRGADLPVSIGRPLPGSRAVVAGPGLVEAADGEAGELCLAGDGLARGYLGRPAKTAEVFVPDPFAGATGVGARTYRTGDLARRLDDGRLDFLGRLDHQVKLRGFRIELGEVEEALLAHPAVAQVVADVWRPPEVASAADGAGAGADPVLVAYWVADGASAADTSAGDLEAHLAERLPGYMVPGRWVRLEEMPLTPNGKVDRRSLPAPGRQRPELESSYRAPEGDTERYLVDLWQELLSLERVGVDDDLFALGGHSLMATRVNVRVRDVLGVELPPEAPFLHRTVAELAAVVDERRAGGGTGGPPPMPPARRHPRDGHLPLGFPQQQIWVINQLRPDNLAYNFQYTVRFHGPMRRRVLERALSEIVRRHEVLRTTFPAVDGEPGQVIHPPWPVPVPLVDLGGLGEAAKRREEDRLVALLVRRRFDVLELPLIVWPMLRLEAEEHLFFQVEQHFVHDGWSIGRMLFEIEALYPAFAELPPGAVLDDPPLPELPVQYADFALWQREWMRGAAREHQLDYWRRTLADAPAPLDLPSDRPRTPALRFAGRRFDVDVPPALYADLREMGRRRGFTLFMIMTAAFEVLMHRYTGRSDFVLGTALANRRQTEFEPLIGMIVNTLVLRADLSAGDGAGAATFLEVLERVRTATLGLQAHQDLPFETLVAELQPERDLSRNPLFQHMFSFHDAPVPDLEFAGLRGELVERHNGSAKTDLNVIVKPRASQRAGRAPSAEDDLLRVLWEYSSDLFDAATARRQWSHYLSLLGSVVEAPETPVDALPLLSAEERHVLTVEARRSRRDYPGAGETVHRAIETWAERSPHTVAVEAADGRSLTYGELEAAANRVAHHLRALGAGVDHRVGVCADRSPELVVALLGVVKAGAAYVPLDPEYPEARLRYMAADAVGDGGVVLTGAGADGLDLGAVRRVDLGGLWDEASELGSRPSHRPPATAAPGSLTYVIYTSGSTGRPKGVMNAHRGIVNRLEWMQEAFPLGSDDVVLQKTPASFDVSVWEFFWPLRQGARLALAAPGGHRDPVYLVQRIVESGVTTLHFVPSMLRAFLAAEVERCTSLRRMICSGEALTWDLEQETLRRLGPSGLELFNLYGPTEAAVDVTWWRCRRAAEERPVPLGREVANTALAVVDENARRRPLGIPGELWIGGVQVARGYHGRPALTAERFVPDPHGAQPGARAYRTGDLGRRRADGELEYLGRIDYQVKLRGFRIELGEIEEALLAHRGVREAAVGLHTPDAGDAELVAYWSAVAPGADTDELQAELQAHLAERLPAYMVPGRWLHLDALPLTPSGKVDRKALPDPGRRDRSAAERAMVAPRNPIETTLAEVWAGVLGVGEIGVEDGFFALGGHSLAGAKAVARSAAALGVDLTLPDLFEHPTIAAFAALVEHRRAAAGDGSGRVPTGAGEPIRRADGDRHAGLPASFDQQRLWLIDRLIPRPWTYHMGRAFRLRGALDPAALAAAVDALGRRHEVLRTTFAERPDASGSDDVRLLQRVAPVVGGPVLGVPAVDLAALPPDSADAEAERLLRAGVEAPFDLAADPPLRVLRLRRRDDDHTVLLTLHHVAADGWSLPVLYRDLAELYRAAATGDRPDLPPIRVQYADFASWQHRRLDGERRDELAEFWRRRLSGAPEVLALPTDRPRPALRSMRGDRVLHKLGAEITAALRRVAAERGGTLFTALLAGWGALLGRLAGSDDVVVGSPVAGRGHADLEPLVGFFVNTLPLRLDLGTRDDGVEPTFADLVARARDTTVTAVAHQELPFERLVEAVAPERNLSHSPLYQATLAYQEEGEPRLELAGADSRAVDVPRREAHYELTLFAAAADDGGLDLMLTYDSDLFDADTVRRWAASLERLLTAAAEDPHRRLAELPLMGEAERRQVEAWARGGRSGGADGAPADALADGAVFRQVLAAAAFRPQAPAVVAGDVTLTYGDLERRSAALARRLLPHLRGRVEPVVGVCMPASPDLAVAVLAAQRAGAAYLPLDPSHPTERLRYTLEDSGAAALLTAGDAATGPAAAFSGPVLRVDRIDLDAEDVAGTDPRLDAPPATPDQLAYVIYTSGTTGRPKGTGLTHRGLTRLVAWHLATYAITADDAGSLVASPAFDASVWELWPCLATGATVHVPAAELRLDPAALHRWLADSGVAVVFLPTALYEAMPHEAMAAGSADGGAPALRTVLVGGDRLHRAPRPGLPFRLVNHYGPTEDTVVTTAGEVPPRPEDDETPRHPPAIGRPVPGHHAHLLDHRLRPVPVGASGEIWIAGDGLARGYLGRPGLTADRFRPHPRPDVAGERLYRTGDLARWLDGGEIAFLGRGDAQVQVRGLRIEPGEIEAVLAGQPRVAAAAVVVDPSGDGGRLVAFVVPAGDGAPENTEGLAGELTAALGDRLPAYMVPAAFAFVDELPLSPTGKVDRRRLGRRAADVTGSGGAEADRPPAGAAEQAVAEIWAEVLGLPAGSVGAGGDFFALGGHSLLATRALAEIRQRLGVEIPLRALFQSPAVADMARHLRAAGFAATAPAASGTDGDGAPAGGGEAIGRLDRAAHRRTVPPPPPRPAATDDATAAEGDDAV